VFENEAHNKTLNLFVNPNALFETRSFVLRTIAEASIFGRSIKFYSSNICKPEEGWFGQPKYCYKKQYTLF